MVIKINPTRIPIWRSPTTLQLGLGNDALVLPNLDVQQEKLVNLLYRGVADQSISSVAKTLGSSDEETGALLQRLSPVLLRESESVSQRKLPMLSEEFVSQAFAEIMRATFSTGRDGVNVFRNRAMHAIALDSADKASLVLAMALATAGVGCIETQDTSPVTQNDLGQLGYANQELGSPRRDALARKIESGSSHAVVLTRTAPRFTMSARVFVGSNFVMPHDYPMFLRGGTPHISIEFGSEYTRVSPLIRPGYTPCLRCQQTERASHDRQWLEIATQLQFRHERLDDVQSTLIATGIALESLLGFIDDPRHQNFEGKLIEHRTGRISSITWPFDPECECREN